VYVSYDYGVTWALLSFPTLGFSVGMSASGQYQTIGHTNAIYYSSNYGQSWTLSPGSYANATYNSVSLSASGQVQIAAGTTTVMYYSTNYGMNWTASSSLSTSWNSCAISANGKYMTSIVNNNSTINDIYTSVTPFASLFSTLGATGATGGNANVMVYNTTTKQISYSSTAKSFVIDHPLDSRQYLVHACLEGAEAGVYYRGKSTVINDTSVAVELPPYVRQIATKITIEITTIYDTEKGKNQNVYEASPVLDNSFMVYGKNGSFFWTITGERIPIQVQIPKTTPINGKGPYKYIV
jgi:hypothetical protein